jgi:hypothetical protein
MAPSKSKYGLQRKEKELQFQRLVEEDMKQLVKAGRSAVRSAAARRGAFVGPTAAGTARRSMTTGTHTDLLLS